MTNIPDSDSELAINDHGQPTSKSSNLRWILGIGGGAIAGVIVGFSIYGSEVEYIFSFGMIALVYLAIGAAIGGVFPRGGCLAGLGVVVAYVALVCMTTASTYRQNEEYISYFFVLFPLVGGGIGLLWSIAAWTWQRQHPNPLLPLDREAVAVARNGRIQLAWACLVVGLVLGIALGILLGGPILVAGPLFGAIVGGTMCLGLMLSAYISGRRK
jgi:hypothetical protein